MAYKEVQELGSKKHWSIRIYKFLFHLKDESWMLNIVVVSLLQFPPHKAHILPGLLWETIKTFENLIYWSLGVSYFWFICLGWAGVSGWFEVRRRFHKESMNNVGSVSLHDLNTKPSKEGGIRGNPHWGRQRLKAQHDASPHTSQMRDFCINFKWH